MGHNNSLTGRDTGRRRSEKSPPSLHTQVLFLDGRELKERCARKKGVVNIYYQSSYDMIRSNRCEGGNTNTGSLEARIIVNQRCPPTHNESSTFLDRHVEERGGGEKYIIWRSSQNTCELVGAETHTSHNIKNDGRRALLGDSRCSLSITFHRRHHRRARPLRC